MFLESSINPDPNDHLRYLVTRRIWEVSELGATAAAVTAEALKAFLTRQEAAFRKPYDRYPVIKPALASVYRHGQPNEQRLVGGWPAANRSWWRNWQALTMPSPALTAISFKCSHGMQYPQAAWRVSPRRTRRPATASNAENEVERRPLKAFQVDSEIDPAHGDW